MDATEDPERQRADADDDRVGRRFGHGGVDPELRMVEITSAILATT